MEGRDSFPLTALEAVHELRVILDDAEAEALVRARELGATARDIAEALAITRQGAYYKLNHLERSQEPGRGEANVEITVVLPEVDTQPHRP